MYWENGIELYVNDNTIMELTDLTHSLKSGKQ